MKKTILLCSLLIAGGSLAPVPHYHESLQNHINLCDKATSTCETIPIPAILPEYCAEFFCLYRLRVDAIYSLWGMTTENNCIDPFVGYGMHDDYCGIPDLYVQIFLNNVLGLETPVGFNRKLISFRHMPQVASRIVFLAENTEIKIVIKDHDRYDGEVEDQFIYTCQFKIDAVNHLNAVIWCEDTDWYNLAVVEMLPVPPHAMETTAR